MVTEMMMVQACFWQQYAISERHHQGLMMISDGAASDENERGERILEK